MRRIFAVSLLSASILTPAAVWAQAIPPVAQDTAAGAQSNPTAGDIIVTAQRRSESLQRVPVSVTAITGDTLAARNLNDLTQVARAAPSPSMACVLGLCRRSQANPPASLHISHDV